MTAVKLGLQRSLLFRDGARDLLARHGIDCPAVTDAGSFELASLNTAQGERR
jgi:hypothetical protein